MTTIAYKDGVIACDGRATAGDMIVSDVTNKAWVRGDVTFFGAGEVGALEQAFAAWPSKTNSDIGEWEALVSDEDGLWLCGCDGETVFRISHDPAVPYAIGSGMPYALTAMDMGGTAKQAVKMAAKRDTGTGGKVRTYKVGA